MDKIIVYLDDAGHARQQLATMKQAGPGPAPGPQPTQWVLVACAPRMTHRISKWVSHSARENWRAKWADKLFEQIVPMLQSRGDSVVTVLAKGPLPDLTRKLLAEHAGAQVVDARRPKFGQELQPVAQDKPAPKGGWDVPGAVLGMGAVLVLAAD